MSSNRLLSTRRRLAVVVFALCVATGTFGVVADVGVDTPLAGGENESEGESAKETADATLVVEAESGERLLEVPVSDGDEVVIAYTHSVEKTDVEDVYVADGTELRMDRMVFSSYGAGLPSEAAVNHTEDGFVVTVDRTFERVDVVTGSVAGHELLVADDRYDLVDLSDGSPVTLFLEDRNRSDRP